MTLPFVGRLLSANYQIFETPRALKLSPWILLPGALYACWKLVKAYGTPSFPGPKGWPLFGHLFIVPKIQNWKYFEKLGHIYGPIVRLSMAGQEMLILNKAEDVEELLVRRSHNYSSRPPFIFCMKYQSKNQRLVFLPYGPELKKQRATFHQMLQPKRVGTYDQKLEFQTSKLLYDMLTRPEEAMINMKRYAASLVLDLTYGIPIVEDEDLAEITKLLEEFVQEIAPGAHLVDTFPILDEILPDFLAPWRAAATKKHEYEVKVFSRFALRVKASLEKGEADRECFAACLWDQQEKLGLDLVALSYIAGTSLEAGTGTVAGTLLWFIMAMVSNPEVFNKAQQEIDAVTGSGGDTMPSFEHLKQLPYCVALTKELFRWKPVVPGGIPHYSDADDVYKGVKIKAGTTVVPCIWSLHHDPDTYPEPLVFKPERFLENGRAKAASQTEVFLDGHFAFGSGRRICPGRYLGSKAVWLAATRIIWAFNILPALDEAGKPITVNPDLCTSGINSEPEPFSFRIIPRSEKHAEVIRRTWDTSVPS